MQMIHLALRCAIAGAITVVVRWVFIYVPTHSTLHGANRRHWIPIIITFPFLTTLTSIFVLMNMDAVTGYADWRNLVRAFFTVVWMCPTNVMCTWLLCAVAAGSRMGTLATYVCAMAVSVFAWVWLAALVYAGTLLTTRTDDVYGYNYAFTAVLGVAGFVASVALNKMPRDKIGDINSSDMNRPKWVAAVLSVANGVLVAAMVWISDTSNRSSLTLTGLMLAVPFGMYVCFGYLWFPTPGLTNAQRAKRCRSVMWPTCYGFRSSDFYCALLPVLAKALSWSLYWVAVLVAFVVAVIVISSTQAALITCEAPRPDDKKETAPLVSARVSASRHLRF